MNWRQDRWWVAGIILMALVAYLPTLQPDISASPNLYLTDVGNNQNALSRWGALHGSAYPLYSFTGNVFVSLWRLLGMEPAMAAGLYSTLWAIAALVMLFVLIDTWLEDKIAGVLGVGLLGLNWVFWLHSSIAEVYSFTSFVVISAMWLAIKADRTRRPGYLYGLAICGAMAVAHHRAIALALLAPFLIALPAFMAAIRRRPLFIFFWLGLAAAAAFGPYLYLLIRVLQQSNWLYGDPTTPQGFWRIMFGEQYANLIRWPAGVTAWLSVLEQVGVIGLGMITWPIALLGILGFAWLFVRRQYRYGLALLLGALPSFLLAIADQTFYSVDVPVEDVPSLLQTTVIFSLLALAFVLSDLRLRSAVLRRGAVVLCAAICLVLAVQNRSAVYDLTHDATGRQIIADTRQFLADNQFATPPAFFSPWGGEFWALAYANGVTGELQNFDLLPNRANVKQAVNQHGRLYAFEQTFYERGLEWWRKRLGQVYLSSGGVKTVAISNQPLLSDPDLPGNHRAAVKMGDTPIALRDWQIKPLTEGRWQVTLFWQAAIRPDRDYSVSVKATDQEVIDSPGDIVAQADSSAPVHGWYPTTLWSPGEIVRDDYVLTVPPGRSAHTVEVNLYTQDAAGQFQNFGRQTMPLR